MVYINIRNNYRYQLQDWRLSFLAYLSLSKDYK